MRSSQAVQAIFRNFRAQYHKPMSHPILDFTNIKKVFRYDTPGPIDNTSTRWLKVNYKNGTVARINYGHTQIGATFRDQIANVLTTLGFHVKRK